MPKALTTEEFVAKAQKIHGDRYDYAATVYKTSHHKVSIRCKEHGVFEQSPLNHAYAQKSGCPKCAGKGVDWLERFQSVHGDRYDYTKVIFSKTKRKVEIVCGLHGSFFQTPENHYGQKQGCPLCRGERIRVAKRMEMAEFVARAREIHGVKFAYGDEQFTNMIRGKVDIMCPSHGWFTQSPVNHLAGKNGCTKCNNMKSAPEDAVARLMAVFTPVVQRDRSIIKPLELDIVLPEVKLAIEYCGEYFHSSGDHEAEAKIATKHIRKYEAAAGQGIRLITVFESEWQNRRYAIRRLLRMAAGKARGKVMARKCELKPVEHTAAVAFYERYHPQGGAGYGTHYGLFWKDKLVACMRFTEGVNDRGANRNRAWTLSRYATRVTVQGGASRLFKAFLLDKNPKTVKSFSDNRYFSGGMYSQLGFVMKENTSADYAVWHPKLGLRPKTHWQRREIPMRARELGIDVDFDPETDPRTERDMTYLLAGRRLYDCGKKRWEWTRP